MQASIVITTFRRTAMLTELLDALGKQIAGRSVEVIVVDNCPDGSARSIAEMQGNEAIRYAHEARSGIVHARNRGVAEARGTYVIFLDDDEVPSPGWLDAFLAHADGQIDMSFGRIAPRLLGPCPPELAGQVARAFSRDLGRASGADITPYAAYLGTGNAMFHKARCLGLCTPFDERFNARGGEDVWLIRSRVAAGHRLIWNHDALVEEQVPPDRMTLDHLRARRFNQGQIRCILVYGAGGIAGIARAAIWMTVGAMQVAGFGTARLLAMVVAPHRTADLTCRISGGAGKVFWRRQSRTNHYAEA